MSRILHENDIPVLVINCSKCKKKFLVIIEMGGRRIENNECPFCGRSVEDPAVTHG